MRLHIVAGGRQSRACGWATPPPACVCRCERLSPKAPPWPHAPHSQMCLPLPPSCTRCWVDLSCCGLVAEQEQDLCGHCRAAPKWARRRVAGGNFSRPPARPPTHLPARPDPHRSRASRALLRPTCGAHLPFHSAAFLSPTAQNARNLACRAPAAMSPERRPAPAHGFVLCRAPRPDPGDGAGNPAASWCLTWEPKKLMAARTAPDSPKRPELGLGVGRGEAPGGFRAICTLKTAPARTR